MSRPEHVYQIAAKTQLYIVLQNLPLEEVTGAFISQSEYYEQYGANKIVNQRGVEDHVLTDTDVLQVYGGGASVIIKAQELISMVLEGLETNTSVPFAHPVQIDDWEQGLARHNQFFTKFGIKYVHAKERFIKLPPPKAKSCPKPVIYSIKKAIIALGITKLHKDCSVAISFGAATQAEVDGSAYVIKKLGYDYKPLFNLGKGHVFYQNGHWHDADFATFDDVIAYVVKDNKLTEVNGKELKKAIADWWKSLDAKKAE